MVDDKEKTVGPRWKRHPKSEQFLLEWIGRFREQLPLLAKWEGKAASCGIPLLEITDHLLLPKNVQHREVLTQLGFRREETLDLPAWIHPQARLPAVLLTEGNPAKTGLALRVESIPDFLQANSLSARIEGSPFGPYRRCNLASGSGPALLIVERRESRPPYLPQFPEELSKTDHPLLPSRF